MASILIVMDLAISMRMDAQKKPKKNTGKGIEMTELQSDYVTSKGDDPSPPALEQLLSQEQIILLTKLLREVLDDTGYGDVKIIVAEKRVVRLKAEKSY